MKISEIFENRQEETESDHDLILTHLKINGTVKTNEATNNRDYKNFNGKKKREKY